MVVTGRVREKKHLPDPVAPDGSLAQGAFGTQAVVEAATWRLAD